MKLNILIFFLFGVSVSAFGIRGFTPIKGSERRLKSSESDSKSSSSESAAVRKRAAGSITIEVAEDGKLLSCTGGTNKCDRFMDKCTTANTRNAKTYTYVESLYESPSSSTPKSSSKSRRLDSSKSKSTSSSEVELVYEYKVRKSDIDECDLGYVRSITVQDDESSSTPTSTTSKKSTRRLRKSSKEPKEKSKSTERARGSGGSSSSSSRSTKGTFIRLWIEDGKEVLKCSGDEDGCEDFLDECTYEKSNKTLLDRSRRLESPSESKSKSTSSGEGTVKLYKLTARNVEDCELGPRSRTVDYDSTSTSTSTSKKSRRWL